MGNLNRIMQRIILKSKIHRASLTDANLAYEGSITIDEDLMDAADILAYEKVDVVNINTGDRFSTYVIKGERGSGAIALNGAAARLGQVGDLLIIISYVHADEAEIENLSTKAVFVDAANKIKTVQTAAVK